MPRLDSWWNDLDSADRITVLRLGLVGYAVLSAVEFAVTGFAGARGVLLLGLVNPVLSLVFARLVYAVIAGIAHTTVTGLGGSSGDPYQVGFSAIEALVVRGEWLEAIAAYRAYLVAYPDHLEARLRLARLLMRNGVDVAEAVALYQEVRRMDVKGGYGGEVSNALLDYFRTSGQRDALRQELMSSAQAHQGTPRGEGARRALRTMAEEDALAGLREGYQ